MIQWMLGIWSLVPLPFLNPACTFEISGSHTVEGFWALSYWHVKWVQLCGVWEHSFAITLLWDWNENWPFPVRGHCWVFQICWHIECSPLTVSSFRIWNSSTTIPSPPLSLFIVMLPKAHLTSHSRMSGSRWVITLSWLSGSWRYFFHSSSVYSCHLLISSASVRSIPFLSFIVSIFAWNVSLVSNFLEEISSFSHSIVFLYFFALFT